MESPLVKVLHQAVLQSMPRLYALDNRGYPMTDGTSYSTIGVSQPRDYFGGRARSLLLAFVSLLAGTFEIFLLLTVSRVPLSIHFPIVAYLLPLFHMLPWLAGLSCWHAVRRARIKGSVSPLAADLCYGVIGALLSATYVVLGCMELALVLPWVGHWPT